jgi:hypothetical protein
VLGEDCFPSIRSGLVGKRRLDMRVKNVNAGFRKMRSTQLRMYPGFYECWIENMGAGIDNQSLESEFLPCDPTKSLFDRVGFGNVLIKPVSRIWLLYIKQERVASLATLLCVFEYS